jgi:hypothetical protein
MFQCLCYIVYALHSQCCVSRNADSLTRIAGILSMIVQAIYAVRPISSRHAESAVLEGLLDKWYIELPEHLRHEPCSSTHPVPLPHVLTLHMQYWCAVLLLHRPL